ncbi:MAG: hypothetical protein WB608_04795 [Terracidiphilus sp.]
MVETFYRIELPVKGVSECYVLVLTSRAASGRKVYLFMEEHGQLDDGSGRFHYEVSSNNPEDGMPYEDALALYNTAKQRLEKLGFIYSFVKQYIRKTPREVRQLEHETMSA